jgi:hypothetical protein
MESVWEAMKAGIRRISEGKKEGDHTQWDGNIERLFGRTLYHLKQLKGKVESGGSAGEMVKAVCEDLQELRPYLDLMCFDYGPHFNR